ncbi:MAG: preprotein translocase subunit SecY [Elusimicrobia bacterium GWA2_69_24]|nr:MAG: preprotein translocase subunit SecY [Elusimicrobia bacterium GWA2_69_24]HBL15699.1 preprotein translocase subunit SecY [Elusimicrobiota bacterium]
MLRKFADIAEVPDLRRRVLFALGCLAVYRFGAAIPIPGINGEALRAIFQAQTSTLLGILNIFSGGALAQFSIFSMGVMPYINASIIMSLLQGAHVIPYLDRLHKEGELGRRKLNQLTRYLTLFLAAFQSFGLTIMITKMPTPGGIPVVADPTWFFYFVTVLTLTTGTVFIMWLGEQMTERGIGNGVSLIIFAGIVDKLPGGLLALIQLVQAEEIGLIRALFILAGIVAGVTAVIWVETAQRKIPVQYAKRVVGRKMYGGAQSFLPLKVDQSGVIAVIFAVSLLAVPMTVAQFMPNSAAAQQVLEWMNRGSWHYQVIYAALIIFFCYFYNSVSINPVDLAENMKKSGGFVPGIRPGEPTAQYIEWVLERITLGGALFVAAVAVLPEIARQSYSIPFYFGGTSMLIVVGVALDTMGQLEAHLIMRHYEGFLKKGRIKQRWFNVGGQ